jgi:uncharacterized protein with PIN domain
MFLVTIAFLVDNDIGATPMPDFGTLHQMYVTGQQVSNLGNNFFCVECGGTLTAAEVSDALNNADFYVNSEYTYRCTECNKEKEK